MATTKMQAPSLAYANSKVQTEWGNYTVATDGTVTVDSRAVPALQTAGFVTDPTKAALA